MNPSFYFKQIFRKFLSNPIKYPFLVFRKVFIEPKKYKINDDYKAKEYWENRLGKYGENIKGPGDEGATEKMNRIRYKRIFSIIEEIYFENLSSLKEKNILEIGTGTGLITQIIKDLGFKNYLGVDITDIVFPSLKKRFPNYNFQKTDITTEKIVGEFDLVFIIDVIEHIVNDDKFVFALQNIQDCLKNNGLLVIAPVVEKKFKSQFYEKHWALNDIKDAMPQMIEINDKEWEQNFSKVFVIRKSENFEK